MELEPVRFGRTGIGVGAYQMRDYDAMQEALGYCLDAPAFIPQGSVRASAWNEIAFLWTMWTNVMRKDW